MISFDGFLSLGFGRPQSQGYENISEQAFLQLCIAESGRPEMRMDLYIASMVQLTKVWFATPQVRLDLELKRNRLGGI